MKALERPKTENDNKTEASNKIEEYNKEINQNNAIKLDIIETSDKKNEIETKIYNGVQYYILKSDYKGEYDLQFINLLEYPNSEEILNFDTERIVTYNAYKNFCNKWSLTKTYFDETKKYVIIAHSSDTSTNVDARLGGVKYEDNLITAYVWDSANGKNVNTSAYAIIIPVNDNIDSLNVQPTCTEKQFNDITNSNNVNNSNEINDSKVIHILKPIIYLYPTEETDVSVELGAPNKIICSYPKYTTGWNVVAKPNGDLKDIDTNKNLYSLYYESDNIVNFKVEKDGFVVKSEDVASFLEEKLEILGLTDREKEEFIVYWLPKLEANKYNYIRFATKEEINKNMPLNITPMPDTIIRVLMTFKGLDKPITVEEQKLEKIERNGFVAVEWGGSELK